MMSYELSSNGKLQMSAFTSANGENKSVVVYSMLFCFLKRLEHSCSEASATLFFFFGCREKIGFRFSGTTIMSGALFQG